MSRTIDEKVVEMRFDNRDFERNVSQSMSTLDKLKSALDFSGAEKAFSGITSATHKLDFGPLGGAIDGVGQKFSALETMAVGALMNIGATIESKLVNTLKSVSIDQVTAGFAKYGEKTTAVQTIMNATGKKIDEVSEKLETLNWFTDETSYNFTDMTSNIGKFTSQRVALDDAVVAMEGISTAAALAGQNAASASRVMYNFSQALGMGSVQVRDWMSVENANMATDEFKQTIIDTAVELGKLDKYGNFLFDVGKGYTGPEYVNALNFRETLAADWFDSEVLIESLKKFGGFSNRLNEVYDQFNENYDVTTSQILTWLEEYMNGTLNIEDAVKKTGLTAEEILPILEELSSEEYDLGRRAFKAAQEAKTFEDVVNATADAVSTAWMNVFEKIFGNYEEARVTWTQLANELWDIFAGPISNLNDLLTDWHDMGGREDFIQSVKNMYHAVRSFLDPIGEAWESVFPPKTADDIYNFTKRLKEFGERLALNETQMNQVRMVFEDFFGIFKAFSSGFSSFGGGFAGFFEGIGNALRNVGTPIYDFLLGVQRIRSAMEAFENGDLSEFSFVQDQIDAYPAAAKFLETYEKIVDTAYTLGHMFGKLINLSDFFNDGALSVDSVIDGIKIKFATILGTTSEIIHLWTGKDISKIVDNLRAIFFGLADGIKAFLGSERWAEVKYGIIGIANAFKDTFGPAWKAAVTILDDWIAGIRTLIEGADGDFRGFFDTITRGEYYIAAFIRNLKGGVEFISDFLVKFLSLTDAINTYRENGGGIVGILAVVHEKLKIIFDTVADLIEKVTGFDAHGIGDNILNTLEQIGYGILQFADTISKALGWENNPFGMLLGKLGDMPEGNGISIAGIFDTVGNVFTKLGDVISKTSPGLSKALAAVVDLISNLVEVIKKIDLETLLKIVHVIATISLLHQVKDTLSEISDALVAYQKKLRADMLLAIAGAILAIAFAAKVISQIPMKKMMPVLEIIGASLIGLIGLMVASHWGNGKALSGLAPAVLAIAAAVMILATAATKMTEAIQVFSDMQSFWEGFGKLGTIMASFLVLLTVLGALNTSGAVLGASKALGQLATVLAVMYPIILAYSVLDIGRLFEGLGKAFLAVTPLLALVGALELIQALLGGFINNVNLSEIGSGLLKISAALAVFTGVMFALTLLDWGDFLSGLGKMALGLGAITLAIAAFSFGVAILAPVMGLLDKFATVLLKIGTAVLFVSAGIGLLGIIGKLLGDQAQEIAEAGVDLILGVLEAVAAHTPEIVAAAVQIIGGIMQGVREAIQNGGVSLADFLAGTGILVGIVGLVWLFKKMKLGLKDFGNAALFIEGAGLLVSEMGILFAAIGYLSDVVGGQTGLRIMQKFCEAIADVFRKDAGVGLLFASLFGILVLLGTLTSKLHIKTTDMAGGLADAFGTIILVITEVTGIMDVIGLLFAVSGGAVAGLDWIIQKLGGPEGGVVKAIEAFGEMAIAIADVIGGVIGHLVGSAVGGIAGGAVEGVMKGYADGLAYIADTADNFFKLMDGLKPGTLEGCKLFADMILTLTGAEILDGLFGWITGGVDYSKFGDGLAAMAPGIKAFAEQTKDLDQGAVEKAAACAQIITAFAKDIPNDGGLIGMIVGNNNLADFAEGVKAIGPALNEFATSTADINMDAVEQAGACADIIIAFAKEIPNDGGVLGWIVGNNDMAAFAEKLPLFAQGLVDFSNIIGGVGNRLKNQPLELPKLNTEAVTSSTEAVNAIIEMAKSVPTENAGWKWFTEGDNSIAKFGANLEKFGTSLVTYSQTLMSDDFSLIVVKNTNSAIDSIISMAQTIGEKGFPDITDFGSKLKTFGASFSDYYKSVKDIESAKVTAISNAINDTINAFMGAKDDSLAGKVATLTTEFLDKLVEAFGVDASKKKSEKAADKFVDYFRDRFKDDASINKITIAITDMISNAVGKDELKEGLKTSGLNLIKEIQNGIEEAFTGDEGLIKKFEQFLTQLETSIDTGGQTGRVKRFYDAGAALMGALRNGMTNEEAVSGFGTPPAKQLKDEFQAILDSLIGMIVSEEMKGQFQRGGASLINSLLGGMKSVDIVKETGDIGKNATLGVGSGMVDETAIAQVKKNAAYVMTAATDTMKSKAQIKSPSRLTALYGWYLDGGLSDGLIDGIPMVITAVGSVVDETKEAFTKSAERGGFDIHSNSWLTTLFGRFLDGGLADGMIDGIPGIRDAVAKVKQAITDKMGLNDLMNLLHDNGLGALEDTFADYVSQFGADFDTEGSMNEFSNQFMSFMEEASANGAEAFMGQYTDGTYASEFYDANMFVANAGADGFTGQYTARMEEYVPEAYATGGDIGSASVYGYADSVISATDEVKPTVQTAMEELSDATVSPVEEGLTELLSYADWVAQKYPEGIGEAFSTPVFDFEDLYANMQGGQLEALLNEFDALDEAGRKNLIRAYGLGEQGGNEDLANYMQWYWKNEPIRIQNEEAIARAQEGYQAYLEEQKALQEAQAVQSQQQYEGVQQIAADMQTHTDEFNAKYLAVVEEIKMNVAALREELDGVHADIVQLNDMYVYLDGDTLVGATAGKMDEKLGNNSVMAGRRVTR